MEVSEAMTEEQIKHMANRFLAWPLPADFRPDCGISAKRPNYAPEVKWEPSGTNLFDARQAEEMVRYMVEGMPLAAALPAAEEHARGIEAAARHYAARKCGLVTDATGSRLPDDIWKQGQGLVREIVDDYLAAVGLVP